MSSFDVTNLVVSVYESSIPNRFCTQPGCVFLSENVTLCLWDPCWELRERACPTLVSCVFCQGSSCPISCRIIHGWQTHTIRIRSVISTDEILRSKHDDQDATMILLMASFFMCQMYAIGTPFRCNKMETTNGYGQCIPAPGMCCKKIERKHPAAAECAQMACCHASDDVFYYTQWRQHLSPITLTLLHYTL